MISSVQVESAMGRYFVVDEDGDVFSTIRFPGGRDFYHCRECSAIVMIPSIHVQHHLELEETAKQARSADGMTRVIG